MQSDKTEQFKPVFKEVQSFRQPWLWVFLLIVNLLVLYPLFFQLIKGEPFGDHPMENVGLVLLAFFLLGINLLFWFAKLTTQIDEQGIFISFFPFSKIYISWQNVKNLDIIRYGFVGYGIRLSLKYGTVYNTSGRDGLWIESENGSKFLVGTQKKEELEKFLRQLGKI